MYAPLIRNTHGVRIAKTWKTDRPRAYEMTQATTRMTAVQAGTASHSVAGLLNPNSTGTAMLVNSGSAVARPARSMRALGAPGPSDKSRPTMAGAQPARNAKGGASHRRQACARASRATVEPAAAISRRAAAIHHIFCGS